MIVKIVTDSTSYIPQHLRDEYDISVVSLGVTMDTETFREEEIDSATFYNKMAQAKSIPTSSQPSPQEFYNVFENIILQGHAVVGIFLSAEMSGTYSTANLVKKMIQEQHPNAVIEIVDSRSNSMELGLAVLAAAQAAKNGAPIGEVVAQAQFVMDRSRFLFLPNTLEYLQKGGRIGGAAALLGSLLQIHPILSVVDGRADLLKKVRKKDRALQEMINMFLNDVKQKGLGEAFIHHINCEDEAQKLSRRLAELIGTELLLVPIGPVIGLHVGPGTVGIVYYTSERGDNL
jgi:DegV family protein with EDD domain